jgi:hypothetical protein
MKRTATDRVRRAVGVVQADPRRLALFFGALAFYFLYWRVDVFITDTFAMVNTVAALNRLELTVEPIVFGTPGPHFMGMHVFDGHLYGRVYGLAVPAVPIVWALTAVSKVAALRVVLAGGWALVIYATGVFAGAALDRPTSGKRVGAALALLSLGGNLTAAQPLPDAVVPLIAIQLVTLVAAALLAVLAYEYIRQLYGSRVGVFAGVAVAFVGPVGFWAPIPKRHTVSALLAFVALYGFYRARRAESPRRRLRYRIVPYVAGALTAWVFSLEGFILVVAVCLTDLLTARDDSPRTLAVVATAFGVALLPFLLTNFLLSGNPLQPPMMLPGWDGQPLPATGSTPAAEQVTASNQPSPATGTAQSREGLPGAFGQTVAALAVGTTRQLSVILSRGASFATDGLAAIEPSRLYHVFVRSGRIPGVEYAQTGGETLELTILESAPLLAVLGLVPLRITRITAADLRRLPARLRSEPIRTTDLFALVYVSVFWVLYLPRLPLHSTITVRYLAPTVPILVYAVCRLRPVREVVTETAPLLAATAVASAVGLTAFFGLALAGASPGTAMQAHAVVNLAVATAVLGWGVAADRVRLDPRLGAVLLGTAIGVTAAFLLLSGVEYLGHGRQFALPLSRLFETLVPVR